jgi:hypothetical protein
LSITRLPPSGKAEHAEHLRRLAQRLRAGGITDFGASVTLLVENARAGFPSAVVGEVLRGLPPESRARALRGYCTPDQEGG